MRAPCSTCESVHERNARLVVRLKHTIAALHRTLGHSGEWFRCPHDPCLAAWETIEGKRAPHRHAA